MTNPASRRRFLLTAPAATGLILTGRAAFAAPAAPAAPEKFQLFTAAQLTEAAKDLAAKPGNNNLATLKETTIVLTTEVAHSAKEFEWHAERDHIVQVLDGTTLYELGGTPKGTHPNPNGKPGEYNSTDSEACTRFTLKKGDMLTIPRNTPHRRSTAANVTFILISSQGMVM
jgi:hypothetical protein